MTFPRTIATHNAHQVFYFDADHMLRRLDHNPHITGAAPIAHYVADHKEFGGFLFPTQRRVYLRDGNGVADKTRALITIAIDDVAIS